MSYLLAGLITYAYVACKAFQQLNVVRDNYGWVLPLSILISALEFWVVVHVVSTGWGLIVLPIGIGGGLGCMTSMWLHRRITKRKDWS